MFFVETAAFRPFPSNSFLDTYDTKQCTLTVDSLSKHALPNAPARPIGRQAFRTLQPVLQPGRAPRGLLPSATRLPQEGEVLGAAGVVQPPRLVAAPKVPDWHRALGALTPRIVQLRCNRAVLARAVRVQSREEDVREEPLVRIAAHHVPRVLAH
eukprot:scaffold12800_cov56-Phaeocystis_antarctica.AAC.3